MHILNRLLAWSGFRISRVPDTSAGSHAAVNPEAPGAAVRIGRYAVELPPGSRLLEYQSRHRRYDQALGEIARLVLRKYPDLRAIDIGANAGDTAALIRKHADIPVLCIEGDPRLVPLLERNVRGFGAGVDVEPSFIGAGDERIDETRVLDPGLNASLAGAVSSKGTIRLRSLQSVLTDHPAFACSKLLKIDTEGFDFRILLASADWLQGARPVVFFEYDPAFTPHEPHAGLRAVEALAALGYDRFALYDNFGNYLLTLGPGEKEHWGDLDAYLAANRRAGTVVFYFDVCAVHADDTDLAVDIRAHELEEAGRTPPAQFGERR